MKKYLIILLLSFLMIPMVVSAENLTPSVDEKEKIYDFADLLDEEEEKSLLALINEFYDTYKMEVVLVSIDENPYGSTDDDVFMYGKDFYDFNKFGVGTSRDGILFLIDMDNRAPAMVTTGKAILVYDDARINNILDASYSYLVDGDYYSAYKEYIDNSIYYAEKGIPESNKDYYIDDEGEYHLVIAERPKKVNWIMSIGVAILGSLIPLLVHLRKYKGIRLATSANEYLKNVEINNKVDQFLTTFTSRTRRNVDNNSHGGSHFGGGGSSISHGSSGMSHGGGVGRHF